MVLKYIILGILQGITEFVPVSSSGHLLIVQRILGLYGEELVISVVLHLGTALALVVFFFKDLLGLVKKPKAILYLAVTTTITVIIALAGKDFFTRLFSSLTLVAFALMVTGIILIATKKFLAGEREKINLKDAAILGISQAIAIIPGISRSGSTISTLLFRGIRKEEAFRFAFLAAIPVIFGAALLEARDINFALSIDATGLMVGFGCSFLTGLVSLRFLKLILKKAKLYYFGYYCIVIALVTLVFLR